MSTHRAYAPRSFTPRSFAPRSVTPWSFVWVVLCAWFALATCLVSTPAFAHPAKTTAVFLDFGEKVVEAEMQIPLDQLGLVFEKPFATPAGAAQLLPENDGALRTYLEKHVQAASPDGRAFSAKVSRLSVEKVDEADTLVARLVLTPPLGASPRQLSLHDDALLHQVVTHKIYVSARGDVDDRNPRASSFEHPSLLSVLHYQNERIVIDRGPRTRATLGERLFRPLLGFVAGGGWAMLLLLLGAALLSWRAHRAERRLDRGSVRPSSSIA